MDMRKSVRIIMYCNTLEIVRVERNFFVIWYAVKKTRKILKHKFLLLFVSNNDIYKIIIQKIIFQQIICGRWNVYKYLQIKLSKSIFLR